MGYNCRISLSNFSGTCNHVQRFHDLKCIEHTNYKRFDIRLELVYVHHSDNPAIVNDMLWETGVIKCRIEFDERVFRLDNGRFKTCLMIGIPNASTQSRYSLPCPSTCTSFLNASVVAHYKEMCLYISRSVRKPTIWTLRKVSTQISLSMPRRLTRTDTFRLLWTFCFRNHYSIRNMSDRISLRGVRRLIWVDTLRRVHNVGFLVERLICDLVTES